LGTFFRLKDLSRFVLSLKIYSKLLKSYSFYIPGLDSTYYAPSSSSLISLHNRISSKLEL